MSNTDNTVVDADAGLTPEQRLEATSVRLVEAGIATIDDMETLRACVAYENTHQNRTPILERLARRADEIRADE
jgi:hypothetical protein